MVDENEGVDDAAAADEWAAMLDEEDGGDGGDDPMAAAMGVDGVSAQEPSSSPTRDCPAITTSI